MLSWFHAIGHTVAQPLQPQRHSGYGWSFWLEKMQRSLIQGSASARLPQLKKADIVPGFVSDNRALPRLVSLLLTIKLLTMVQI